MYKYLEPTPVLVSVSGPEGFKLRQLVANYLESNKNSSGAERGSEDQQGFGLLAEIVVRKALGMKLEKEVDQPLAYDILTPAGVKIDIKCRGGEKPFLEEYASSDGVFREAKHNLFARQVYDDRLDTDIYLMTHLERPKSGTLPGRPKQRKWKLFVCGWVSKLRAKREGVYLPRGSLTERGVSGWFPYRGQEIEFYNKNLNGIARISDLFGMTTDDVRQDQKKKGGLNLTSVDAMRIVYDLIGRGILTSKYVDFIKNDLGIKTVIKPFLHPNQYNHLLRWLCEKGQLDRNLLEKAKMMLPEERFKGI